jgi:hypothetical protein
MERTRKGGWPLPEVVEGDRIRVTGRSDTCFFPRTERETNYSRDFDGRTSDGPFLLGSSVYGRSLRFTGPGECHGIVVGRGDVRIDVSRLGERQRFRGGLSTNGSIDVAAPRTGLRDSLVGDIRNASLLVRGDVVGDDIHLRNTIVVGNVQGSNVFLSSCVVFGAAVASEQLTLSASSCLYYHSRLLTFEGPCLMLQAMGDSAVRPSFVPLEDGEGEAWTSEVLYYPVIRRDEGHPLGNRPWAPSASARMAKLYPAADWVTVATEAEGRTPDAAPVTADRTILTIAGRALNLGALQIGVEQMAALLKISFEFDHYSDRGRREAMARVRAVTTDDEYWVFANALEREALA